MTSSATTIVPPAGLYPVIAPAGPRSQIEEAIRILGNIQNTNQVIDLSSNYEYQKDLAYQNLLRAWLNYTIGSADEYVMKVENNQISYVENPDYADGMYQRLDKLNMNSQERIHYLAFIIEPKLKMIRDAQHTLEKLQYFNKMKNDPNFMKCTLDLENSIRYLMDNVKPHLTEFLSLNGITNDLNTIPTMGGLNGILMGGARKRKHKKNKHSKKNKSHSQEGGARKKRKHSKKSKSHSQERTKKRKHSKKSKEVDEMNVKSMSKSKSKRSKRSKRSRSRSRSRSRNVSPRNVMKIEF